MPRESGSLIFFVSEVVFFPRKNAENSLHCERGKRQSQGQCRRDSLDLYLAVHF